MHSLKCRACDATVMETFVDLGVSPLANSYLRPEQLLGAERFYPLHVLVCQKCLLVQLGEFESPEHIFSEYLYFSSFSKAWLEHAAAYVAAMSERLRLGTASRVVELASNDGYLLQYFVQRGIPVLGVEPAANVAKVAIDRGVPTEIAFFGRQTASRVRASYGAADLIVANNVLAHVPDLNDFVDGMKRLLAEQGTITVEAPHLLRLIAERQFDTIYHEHFSYFSLKVIEEVFARHGLRTYDVEQLPTHGGSLRYFACHATAAFPEGARVRQIRALEQQANLLSIEGYRSFSEEVVRGKCDIIQFFADAKRSGKRVAGYGAPAKGNTLLNYCGIRRDFLDFTVDRSPYKQGLFLPGTHIPIKDPSAVLEAKPDYLFILPWNLKDEIMEQMAVIREWGGRFAVAIPRVEIL